MTLANVDYRAHAQAVRDLLTATLPAGRVFDADEVPGTGSNGGTLPLIYVVPHISGIQSFEGLRGTVQGLASWRINVSISGRTADEVRRTLWRVRSAMDGERLEVGGDAAYLSYQLDTLPAADEGRYFASIEFTYTL